MNPSGKFRDIHALSSPPTADRRPPTAARGRARDSWEAGSHRSSTLSVSSEVENFNTMSREFSATVITSSNLPADSDNLARIGEDDIEDTNPLAIIPDHNPSFPSLTCPPPPPTEEVSIHRVKKDEVEMKVSTWQGAEIAKINNRFKHENAPIRGWESEQVERTTTWLKKVDV